MVIPLIAGISLVTVPTFHRIFTFRETALDRCGYLPALSSSLMQHALAVYFAWYFHYQGERSLKEPKFFPGDGFRMGYFTLRSPSQHRYLAELRMGDRGL